MAMLAACNQTETPPAPEATGPKKLGIQLYTLRTEMERDLNATITRVAEIGYKEVEFAGYYNRTPTEIKALLESLELTSPSAHVSRDLIRDNPMPSIEAGAAIGHETLVLNWLAPEERDTLDKYRAWADVCNRFAEQAKAAGMNFCYHNHDFEFQAIDGVVPYDILFERCDPALVNFELDLYWAAKAGQDVGALLNAHPGRFPLCHVKDMAADGAMADVGAGTIDFAGIFAAHQFEHYYVERDDTTAPFDTAQISFNALNAILNPA